MPNFVDIHCHILPGLDDGARDWDETLAMARRAVAEDVSRVIATPHQSEQYPSNSRYRILELVREARERFQRAGVPLEILPGADVRVTEDLVTRVTRSERLTLGDLGKHILLELPSDVPLSIGELIYELELRGIRSILSHPERNTVFQEDITLLEPLVGQGCMLQITAGSFLGTFGPAAGRTALELLRADMVHVVASDAHDDCNRPFAIAAAYDLIAREVGVEQADTICCTAPAMISDGIEFEPPLPSLQRRGKFSLLRLFGHVHRHHR